MKKAIITCIIFCFIPLTSFAGIMEEVKVIGVKLIIKQDWQTYYTANYNDDGVVMDTTEIPTGGGGGVSEEAEEDSTETELIRDVSCGDMDSRAVATLVFYHKFNSKTTFGKMFWLSGIRDNDSKWELEFEDGSTGTYEVGLVPGTDSLTSESCSG